MAPVFNLQAMLEAEAEKLRMKVEEASLMAAKAAEEAEEKVKMIAEDLGELSDEVVELRSFKNIPGMKVFQFEFDKICKDI